MQDQPRTESRPARRRAIDDPVQIEKAARIFRLALSKIRNG
jgi:hypothetical protein